MAVFVGSAVGNGTAYAVLTVLSLGLMWVLTAEGVPPEQLYARAYQSTPYLLFAHGVGTLCCAAGGYWSARLGPETPYANALWSAAVVAGLALVANFYPFVLPIPLWSRAASLLLPFAGFPLGAHWWLRTSPP